MFPKDINRIHINYSQEKSSDGTIIRSTIMINIHEDDVVSAVALYWQIKDQLETAPVSSIKNEIKVKPFPECPTHHVSMLLRSRRDTGEQFFGCPLYRSAGCQKTVQYLATKNENFSALPS